MSPIAKILVSPSTPIRDTIQVVDHGGLQTALVVDDEGRLLGTVTDGDIRRAIIRGVPLDEPTHRIMTANSIVANPESTDEEILNEMRRRKIRQIPIVGSDDKVLGLRHIYEITPSGQKKDNLVVLMAGGLGTRLLPLTQETPKPMLRIGDKPILQWTLESLIKQGFSKFYFAVNHLAEQVERYFGDGTRFGVSIDYLREDKKLGTAGALGLLDAVTELPLVVMNADLVTKVNYAHLLHYHDESAASATMCVREYNTIIPYGVVDIDDAMRIQSFLEKPIHRVFVNCGIYCLDPNVLKLIPKMTRIDMPDLFDRLRLGSEKTIAFPLREYWLDIGRADDFRKAEEELIQVYQEDVDWVRKHH